MENIQVLVREVLQRSRENLSSLLLMSSIPIINIFYPLLNSSQRGVNSLVTELDNSIPLVKVFIIPYVAWYGFIFLTLVYLCLKDKKVYLKTLISINISLIICYTIYYFYQTTVPRPILIGDDGFTKLLSFIYQTDQPFNCFPSIHCLTSFLMMKAIHSSSVKNFNNQVIVYTTGILIILSTLFVKQHVILDVMGALFLSHVIFESITIFHSEKERLWKSRAVSTNVVDYWINLLYSYIVIIFKQ